MRTVIYNHCSVFCHNQLQQELPWIPPMSIVISPWTLIHMPSPPLAPTPHDCFFPFHFFFSTSYITAFTSKCTITDVSLTVNTTICKYTVKCCAVGSVFHYQNWNWVLNEIHINLVVVLTYSINFL